MLKSLIFLALSIWLVAVVLAALARAWSRLGTVVTLAGLAGLALLAPPVEVSHRAVLIVDGRVGGASAAAQAYVERQRPAAIARVDVRDGASTGDGCFGASVTRGDLRAALRHAERCLDDVGVAERAWDTMVGRARRVVVVTARRLDGAGRVSALRTTRALDERGAQLVLLTVSGAAESPVQLELEVIGGAIAANRSLPDDRAVRVRLRAEATTGGSMQLACTIDEGLSGGLGLHAPIDLKMSGAQRSFDVPLSTFDRVLGGTPFLSPGFHLVQCRATVGEHQAATASVYVEAVHRRVAIVAGEAGRFEAHVDPVAHMIGVLRHQARQGGAWPTGVYFAPPLTEASYCEALESWSQPEADRPVAIVMHDVSDAGWNRCPSRLRALVQDGLHLLAAGVPSSAPLPLGLTPAAVPGIDRRPRLTFLLDASRIGRLPKAPTSGFSEALAADAPDGLAWQRAIRAQICDALAPAVDCAKGGKSKQRVEVRTITWPGPKGADAETAFANLQLERRLEAIAQDRPKDTLQVGDVLIVFAYDVPQTGGAAVRRLLISGAVVIVVPVQTPFTAALTNWSSVSTSLSQALQAQRVAATTFPEAGTRLFVEASQSAALPAPDVASRVAQRVRAHLDPRAVYLRVQTHDRAIDEAVPRDPEPAARWAAPVRFQNLVAPGDPRGAVLASTLGGVAVPGGLRPRPIAWTRRVGRGLVSAWGYSPFEGAYLGRPTPAQPPRTRIYAGARDPWGSGRGRDFARFAAQLEPAPHDAPRLRRVERDPSGRTRLLVTRRFSDLSKVTLPQARACGGFPVNHAAEASRCVDSQDGLRLIGLGEAEDTLVYEAPPSAVRRWTSSGAAVLRIAGCPVMVAPPAAGELRAGEEDLRVAQALALIARFTGGQRAARVDEVVAPALSLRTPALLLFVAGLTALFALRMRRRLVRAHAARQATRRTQARFTSDPDNDLPATVATLGGSPSANTRFGDFAGRRPMAPGDGLANLVLEDLAVMATAPMLPRVAQRITPKTGVTQIQLSVGPSMRALGRRASMPPKVAAALRVTLRLAAEVWATGGAVQLEIVGLQAPRRLEPLYTSEPEALVRAVRDALSQPAVPVSYSTRIEATRVLVVSDFMSEDLGPLATMLHRVEEDGGAAGAVHVFSPAEYQQLDVGTFAGFGGVADRSEWTPRDVRAAHLELLHDLEAELSDLTGGVVVVSSTLDDDDLTETLRHGRTHLVLL